MAKFHSISNSTQFLINGMMPIRGKKFSTFEEIYYFYTHHESILTEIQVVIAGEPDEILFKLNNDETRLGRQLEEGIAAQTIVVDKRINEYKENITAAGNIVIRSGWRVRYWIAVVFRNHRIHRPFTNLSIDLKNVRYQKARRINKKQSLIDKESDNIKRSYEFLKANETFLIGAQGEEAVNNALLRLSDEFNILNDVNLRFRPSLFWNKTGEYIKTCQIDHIVAGPTGIFVLETKNWSSSYFEKNLDRLQWQVNRSAFALRSYIQDHYSWILDAPKIFYVLISVNDKNPRWELDRKIEIVYLNELCDYILKMEPILSDEALKKFIKIVSSPYSKCSRVR